jgi:two-component system, chemotaxis family, chemotaxis protein CheY
VNNKASDWMHGLTLGRVEKAAEWFVINSEDGAVLDNRTSAIKLAGLSFLLADPNPHSSAIVHGILRGFGATRVIEVRTSHDAVQVLTSQRIDVMLVEPNLDNHTGLAFIRSIRQDAKLRAVPILLFTGDTRSSIVKAARDCGANMVIAKPISPTSLYDRLTWVAFHSRNFIEAAGYFDPDRSSKINEPHGGASENTAASSITAPICGTADA